MKTIDDIPLDIFIGRADILLEYLLNDTSRS